MASQKNWLSLDPNNRATRLPRGDPEFGLAVFSRNGYDGVGVREIARTGCDRVGEEGRFESASSGQSCYAGGLVSEPLNAALHGPYGNKPGSRVGVSKLARKKARRCSARRVSAGDH
jgi:hypothetical protein